MPGGTSYYFSHGISHLNDWKNYKLVTSLAPSEYSSVDELTGKGLNVEIIPSKKTVYFENSYVIDGRMDAAEARKSVSKADVVWLAGGDTPVQYAYLVKYGLDDAIRKHPGLIIGMSAGSINLGKTAICTLTCRHNELEIYNALGCVDISVEPHFDHQNVTDELMQLSKEYTIYGLCDDSVIVCSDEKKEFYGEVYKLSNGIMEQLET